MEASPWAPRSPRRGRAPAPMAPAPRARYASAPSPARPPPFSSWHDYLGLATLITKAGAGEGGGGSPPCSSSSSSSSSCCSPHAGALAPAPGPPDCDDDDDDDDDSSDEPGCGARGLRGALELRALRLCARPAGAGAGALRARVAALGPCVAAAAAEEEEEEEAAEMRAPAWAAAPPLQLCVFCRNNREAVALYTTHVLKGPDGRVLCPVLRRYTCPLCGASGDNAHTIKYCPLSKVPPPPPGKKPR